MFIPQVKSCRSRARWPPGVGSRRLAGALAVTFVHRLELDPLFRREQLADVQIIIVRPLLTLAADRFDLVHLMGTTVSSASISIRRESSASCRSSSSRPLPQLGQAVCQIASIRVTWSAVSPRCFLIVLVTATTQGAAGPGSSAAARQTAPVFAPGPRGAHTRNNKIRARFVPNRRVITREPQ